MNRKRIAAILPAAGLAAAALSALPAHAQLSGGTTRAPEVLVIRKVDAVDHRYIGADSNAYHSVAKGATFNGDSCTRGGDDLDWSCEDLNDYAWFHNMLPEDGNTDGYFNREIPLVSSPDGSVVQRVDVAEATAPTGYAKINGVSTVHLDPASGSWVADTLPDGVTLTHSNGFAYWSWNDKPLPVVHPTPVVTHVPAVTKQVTTPAHHVALVQLDTYLNAYGKRPMTKAQIAQREAARKADKARGTLLYRQGSASPTLWGSTTSVIKSMDVCALPTLPANVDAWVLGAGATAAQPWGASHKVAQVAPSAVDCKPVTSTVVVTPAHNVTTYTCPDGTVASSADAVCEAKGTSGGMGGSYGG